MYTDSVNEITVFATNPHTHLKGKKLIFNENY